MKAAVRIEGGFNVQDVPEPPEPGPDQVKVKIAYCGICGSELHSIDPAYTSGSSFWGKIPQGVDISRLIGGHEASGTVVAVGSNVTWIEVGERVAMNFRTPCGTCYYCRNMMEHFCERPIPATGSYAEYALYHANAVYKLPDNVSLEVGAILEPLTVAVHAVDQAEIKPGHTVAILGAGPIGILILEVAMKAGAARVLVSEPVEGRRELARKLGATVVVDPVKDDLLKAAIILAEGRGFDRVFDASGKTAVARQAFDLAGRGGVVVLVAVYPPGTEIGLPSAYPGGKEITVKGTLISPYCFPRSINLLSELELEPLISIRPLEEVNKAYHDLLAGRGMKVLLKP
jgi:2-desacetyl-2-hydroxyethyl bacteriochlorophyllide A dehydrogenase